MINPAAGSLNPASFGELTDFALGNRWCTRPACTTCGARPFRTALRALPTEEVIDGLRLLSSDFIARHADMFRLVVSEISSLPDGVENLASLAGTPAGDQLRAIIAYQRRDHERRQAYLATQTREAIADRRAQKKLARELATAPHRQRKAASQATILDVTLELKSTPDARILEAISGKEWGIPMRAIAGLVFTRLLLHYKNVPMQAHDLHLLDKLAKDHSGHWMKLFNRISQRV